SAVANCRVEDRMYQQWLQVIGLLFDGLGFALIALEWFAATVRCAAKSRLWRAIWSAPRRSGCSERSKTPSAVSVSPRSEPSIRTMQPSPTTQHAYEIDQVDRFRKAHARLFFAGVIAFIAGMVLQLLGAWPGCCASIGIIPQSLG